MKKVSTNIKPPKRSSSLVSRITRPIIEQQMQKTISPSSSFSSSILMKGMSERITPPPPPPPPPQQQQQTDSQLVKSNRQRTIDHSRRRTVTGGIQEYHSNKENISVKTPAKPLTNVYQFPTFTSNNRLEIHIPSSKHTSTKKYYFHSDSTAKPTEDLLNNSYGLTLLTQQARHSNGSVLLVSQISNHLSSQKPMPVPRTSIPQTTTLDSLDDLLCDREVESYFYPLHSQPEHIYTNLENSSTSSSVSYYHGTLC